MEQLLTSWNKRSRSTKSKGAVATIDAPAVEVTTADTAHDVEVIYGASTQTLPLAGLTVAEARPLLETILAVQPQSPALVNGRRGRASYVIARGDALEFIHHAGEKGKQDESSHRNRRRSGGVPPGRREGIRSVSERFSGRPR